MNQPIWIVRQYDIEQARTIAKNLGISITAAILLQQRGLCTEEQCRRYLSPRWEELTSPHALKGMVTAIEVIEETILARQPIIVYGDYDVDGVCSTVILRECLEMLGAEVDYYIPDRFQEGYGLNMQAVRQLVGQGYGLLITVDCGIRSVDEVAAARRLGMKVVVTDHHMPGEILPEADAIINPQLDDHNPGSRKLCGAGVAYQLARALTKQSKPDLWLDLVALATIADIVELTGDNRILVRHGLQCLSDTVRPGLRALMDLGGIKPEERLDSWQIGFILAPRLNAAGRLDHARLSVELLYSREEQQASYLAERLDRLNEERKQIEEIIVGEASLKIAHQPSLKDKPVLLIDGSDWHHGVLGIVASRLCEQHHKPVILINWEDDIGRGSCRSIEGFDINAALQACHRHLRQFGGHPMAAGLTIERSKLSAFDEALQAWSQQHCPAQLKRSEHHIDIELTPEELNCQLWQEIQAMEPFGPGNHAPVLAVRGAALYQAGMVGSEGQHFKARLQGTDLGVIAFGKPHLVDFKSSHYRADISFQLDRNQFRGRTSLQLKVKEMRTSYQTEAQSGHTPASWLSAAVSRLEQQQVVVLNVPTYRLWKKVRHYLQLWLCESVLYSLHGHMPLSRRQAGERALHAGVPGIYIITRAYNYYMQHNGLSWQGGYAIDLQAREEGAATYDIDESSDRSAPFPLSLAYPIKAGNMLPKGRYAVYVNRPRTLQGWQQRHQNLYNEVGLNDTQQRRRMRMQFSRAAAGFLLTDGNACGDPVTDIDGIWLADLPFSLMEITQLYWELGGSGATPLGLLFEPEQAEANRSFLERFYPGPELLRPVYTALCSLGPQALQGEPAHLCQALSDRSGVRLHPTNLGALLQILVDLGLCQVKKKGSIMAIKLVPQVKTSFDMVDSPYYLEGLAEKKAFHDLMESLQLLPLR